MRGTANFLLRVAEETWYCELRDERSYYVLIAPCQILSLLESRCGGLQAYEAAILLLLSHGLWHKAEGVVPVYLNLMEDTQRKEKRAKVEIRNLLLVLVSANSIFGTNYYPRECDNWESRVAT